MSLPSAALVAGQAPGRFQVFHAAFLQIPRGAEEVQHGAGRERHAVIGPRQELNVEDAPRGGRRRGSRRGSVEAGIAKQQLRDHVVAERFLFLQDGVGERIYDTWIYNNNIGQVLKLAYIKLIVTLFRAF